MSHPRAINCQIPSDQSVPRNPKQYCPPQNVTIKSLLLKTPQILDIVLGGIELALTWKTFLRGVLM